ncbi:MAG TPA: hypothetical protein EYQ00_15760, partial [Dehalococcoidia bacterium]|nr:hypothetical protein [Dehalococcoidia bacterium]
MLLEVAAAAATLAILSPTANQILAAGTTSHTLSVDITGNDAPGHWHWKLDTPLAGSGPAGGQHVDAGVTTAMLTGLTNSSAYTVYATLADPNHNVLGTPVADSVAFSVGGTGEHTVRVANTQGSAGAT